MLKRIFIFILLVIVIMASCGRVYAASTIAGGAIAGVTALLAYYGIDVVASSVDSSQYISSMDDLLQAYAAYIGSTVTALFPSSAITAQLGRLIITSDYANNVIDFLRWLQGDDTVIDYNMYSGGTVLNGYNVIALNPGEYTSKDGEGAQVQYNYTGGTIYIWYYVTRSQGQKTRFCGVGVISRQPFSGNTKDTYGSPGQTFSSSITDNGWYIGTINRVRTCSPAEFPLYYHEGLLPDQLAAMGNNVGDASITLTGVADIPDDAITDSVDVNVIGMPVDATDAQAYDYVIDSAVDGSLVVSSVGAGTGFDDPVTTEGLTSVFPFCIPFDLYRMGALLSAEPVTPIIHYPFVIDGIIDTTIDIDFTPWDGVARILRIMELLVFAAALAVKTRDIIRG